MVRVQCMLSSLWHGGVYLAKLFIEKWALKSSASQDFRRSGEGTSYSNGGPAYTYERPHHHDARPPYSSNDNRPMYSNGRIPHYGGDFSTEENDRAIALALSEEDHSEFIIHNHFCFCVCFVFFFFGTVQGFLRLFAWIYYCHF